MLLANNSISFQSKIKFVNTRAFSKLPLKKCEISGDYIAEPWSEQEIIKTNQGYTDRVQSCSAGGIVTDDAAIMYHLNDKVFSRQYGFAKVKEVLDDKYPIAKNNSNALIVGGKFLKRSAGDGYLYNRYYDILDTSERLKNNLVGFFNSKKIDYSMFWGQPVKGNASQIFYSNKKGEDTWYINNYDSINNIEDLKKIYSFIKISEKDQKDGVYINGNKLSDGEIEDINSKFKLNKYI